MLINLRVKTLDAQTHDFSIDNELTIRQFKDKIAEKTNIAADQQRIIYCGRVLADEKQLKEYDVDGKVVHVAERPPPSQRGPSTSSSSTNDTPPTRERTSNRGGMRNSPLFRALDGMVVGTMAIPMNPVQNNSPQQGNPFAASSSFCMNRITVARHMLDCANNIAAYLEDPERGLNNTSLDILARGSWTMESTVVEVGFTAADLPQNQNIVEMVQDAVSAALRRNSNTNVTVVQLPTVFGSSEGGEADAALRNIDAATNMDATEDGAAVEAEGAAAVIIEDVIDDAFEGGATGSNDNGVSEASNANNTNNASLATSPTTSDNAGAAADTSNASTNTGTNTEENQSRRRTNTRVLAEVVAQMRTVQIRLNPFIQQFYELLNNDPTFEEGDTSGRENAQRLYNRVSEALHYMSHAQHAISDLMLDVSQPAPRFLTCRPILVEQSGYVSSNNYLSTAAAAVAAATGNNQARPRTRTFISPRYNHPVTITTNSQPTTVSGNGTANGNDTAAANVSSNNSGSGSASGSSTTANGGAADSNSTTANASGSGSGSSIEDPVDEPLTNPNARGSGSAATNAATQSNDGSTLEIVLQPRRGLYFGNNPQVQMSRLIQAMVNSAPINTELHVQILPPTIVSVPVSARVAAGNNANSEQRAQAGASAAAAAAAARGTATGTATATGAAAASNNNASNNSNSNSARATANANNVNNNLNSNNSGAAATGIILAGNNANRPVSASLAIGTLPTTSTQTRSTSRPQLQIGGIPANGWNGRFIPANMMSSFDRFLPCNSHHIREPETNSNGNGGNGTNGGNATPVNANTNSTTNNPTPQVRAANTPNPRPPRTLADILSVGRATPTAGGPTTSTIDQIRNLLYGPSTSSPSGSTPTASSCRLQAEFRNFFAEQLFYNTLINEQTVPPIVDSTILWMNRILVRLPEYELPEVDARKSVANIVRLMLPQFIETVVDGQCSMSEFEERLMKICKDFITRLYSVFIICAGRSNADVYWPTVMSLFQMLINGYFSGEALAFLRFYFNRAIPSSVDTEDAQQFIVYRNSSETDVEMESVEASSPSGVNNRMEFTIDIDNDVELEPVPVEPLPSVTAGSEPWHRNFPEDWLPVITRDLQLQSENPPNQAPFSDAYISGMSSKRKKMIQNNKPPTDVSSLIARSVRKAIQTVGPRTPAAATAGAATASTSAAALTAEEITEAIANDTAVQASCTETVRVNVRERLKKDSDYKAEKFPHTAKFVNK
ncbi:GATA zinc finger domain-containing protein 14 isoform X2 [Ceratitis capitata]|nr:GATA zinc finger domain-containing protein 14 isoform X2 [Ceratitis capitata]